MDVVTESSNHNVVGMAVSVCLTPAAPSPLPIPYPLTGSSAEGVDDSPMRTKMCGVNGATVGANVKVCHGNEPGTLKEVVSLDTAGRCPPLTGAFTVLAELGPLAITGSMVNMNKGLMPGMASNASDASGTGGGGGGGGSAPGAGGAVGDPNSASNSGGDGGGSSSGASASPGKAGPSYCPQAGKTAPPGMQQSIDSHDLRKIGANISNATQGGKEAAFQAMFMPPGTAGGAGQAFYSGAGRGAAKAAGYQIQEDSGGAAALEANTGQPAWSTGSNLSGENAWKTISQRSAENASGTVGAFVVGQGGPRGAQPGSMPPNAWDTVFSTTELPTLLHTPYQTTNPDGSVRPGCQQIDFKDGSGLPAGSWKRSPPSPDCPTGAWTGDPATIPSTPRAPDTNPKSRTYNPDGVPCPGFTLDPTKGFTRP